MPASRRLPLLSPTPRRPLGPRCHGGASSLLRLGFGVAAQRSSSSRPAWRDVSSDADETAIEHVVGWPVRTERAAALAC